MKSLKRWPRAPLNRSEEEKNQARAKRDEEEHRRQEEKSAPDAEAEMHRSLESGMDAYARLSRKEDKSDKSDRDSDTQN